MIYVLAFKNLFILNGSLECTECSKNGIDTERDFCFTFQVTSPPDAKAVAFEKALDVFHFPGNKYMKITILKKQWRQLLPDNFTESNNILPGTSGRWGDYPGKCHPTREFPSDCSCLSWEVQQGDEWELPRQSWSEDKHNCFPKCLIP